MSLIACGTAPDLCKVDETVGTASVSDVIDWTEFQPIIEKTARRTTWKFRQYVEFEDVLQTGWLYYFENRSVLDVLYRDPYGLQFVKRRIQSACNAYALKEMCAKTGIQWEDQYTYSRSEIRFLVRLGFCGLAGGESPSIIAGYVDVWRAMMACGRDTIGILYRAYGPDREDGQLSATERGRVARAVGRVQAIVNGEAPG